ncbi:STAS domain-containing protein [Stenotrophomonas pennii]|uniref:STAS domain-containing protein n=1 Tax=Stenotrophomonas lacuserhaii TaxID=2760084 RepID=UPI003208D467
MASNSAQARLDKGTLRLSGVLDRGAVIALWPQLQSLGNGAQALDLTDVARVDSAGVALLAELAARARQQGRTLAINGSPAGLTELEAAYRLSADLDFNAPSAAS